MADGRKSLHLEYYLGYSVTVDKKTGKEKIKHDRRKETLNLYLLSNPKTSEERQLNRETLLLAQKIRAEKEQEFRSSRKGYRLQPKNINFIDYFQAYIDKYTKKDVKVFNVALSRFKDFLLLKYLLFQKSIKIEQLNKDMMVDFVEYLKSRSKGQGAATIFQRFKKVVCYASGQKILKENPCSGVICKANSNTITKDILSIEEVQQLITTQYAGLNNNIRRAFIFSLYTGIRFTENI